MIWLLFSVLTLGNAGSALHYALIDIPKDQGWYFGSPPNSFLASSTIQYLWGPRMFNIVIVITLGLIAIVLGLRHKIFEKRILLVFFLLIIYSSAVFAASSTGYWAPDGHLIPMQKTFGLIFVVFIVKFITDFAFRKKIRNLKIEKAFVITGTVLTGAFLIYNGHSLIKKINDFEIKNLLVSSFNATRSSDDTYVSQAWHDRVRAFEGHIPKRASLWSTYTSLYDSLNSTFNPSSGGEDYIIHALGPDRREKYFNDFISQKPEYVITMKPSYFIYEEWLWGRHWEFYKDLISKYQIIADNDSHILWQRLKEAKSLGDSEEYNLDIKNGKQITFISDGDSNQTRVYQLKVDYEIANKPPFVSKTSRYLLNFSNKVAQEYPISLPDYKTSWTFPFILSPGENFATIEARLDGLFSTGEFRIIKATYQEIIPGEKKNLYLFHNNYCRINKIETGPCNNEINILN